MATTLFQAISAIPGKMYEAFGQVADVFSGRRAKRESERNQKEFVEFFSEKLVSAFRAGRVRLLPYYDNLTAETEEHRQAYRWLLKEPAIKSAFMSKLLSVMSLDLQVDPVSDAPRDKEIASFVEDSLRRCKGGPAEIIWSILFGALLEGNGLAEKVFGKVDRGKYRGRPTIQQIKAKDSHDYQIEIDEFNNPTTVISRRTADEFPVSDFTFFSHMPGFSNPAGMSDLRAVYRAGWMLDTVWKLRAIGLERFTLPIFMSKYPAGRIDIRDSINEAVKKAKALGYLSVPQEAAVEAIEMASKSGSDFDAAIKALQEECFIGIQGATLQAMAGAVPDGSGKSSVHKSTTELFVWYLSVAAATVVNDQVIPDIVDLNYADAEYPTAWFGGINDGDLKAALDIDLGLLQLGVIQDPQDLSRRYRRQMAKNPQAAIETLKLIKTMGMQQPPPPGMPGSMAGLPDLGDGGGGADVGGAEDAMGKVVSHMQDGGGNGGDIPFDESGPVAARFDESDWSGPSRGNRGGTYWVHKKTGKKVYQQDNPGGSGGDDAVPAEASQTDTVKSKQNVKAIVSDFQMFKKTDPDWFVETPKDVEKYLGTKDAGPAALLAFSRGSFVQMNSDPASPVTKAMADYISNLPDANPGMIHRVIAFKDKKELGTFLKKFGKEGDITTQERSFSSWTTSDPTADGANPFSNIGLDIADQFGPHKVFLTSFDPKGAKDISFVYDANDKGVEFIQQAGTKFKIASIKNKEDGVHIQLDPVESKPAESKLQTPLAKEKVVNAVSKQDVIDSPPLSAKSAARMKPRPADWNEAILPGAPAPKWNVATSTGYARAKPLIDEAKRLYADPSKVSKEDVKALAEKIAFTTGKDALYTLAQAVGVKSGSAKAIAERVLAPFTKEELDLPDIDPTKEAVLQRKLKEAGVSTKDAKNITSHARTLRDEGNKQIDLRNEAVKDAYAKLSAMTGKPFTKNHPAFNGGDYTSVKGFDTIASELAGAYPGVFSADASYGGGDANDTKSATENMEKLWTMLGEGVQPRLSINDTFEQAHDEWEQSQKHKKEESVPFGEK